MAGRSDPVRPDLPYMLALPILPVRLQTSIVGRIELNFCVRDGNRWTLDLINTNYHYQGQASATISIVHAPNAFVKRKMVTRGRVELPFAA